MKSELIIGNLRQINSSKALVLLLEFIKKYGINYFSNFVTTIIKVMMNKY